MRKVFYLIAALTVSIAMNAQGTTETVDKAWTFTTLPSSDVSNITADKKWIVDSKNRYCDTTAIDNAPLTANGVELTVTKGLLFTSTANASGNIRLAGRTATLWLGANCKLTIPARKKGEVVTISYMTSNKSAKRNLGLENIAGTVPMTTGTTRQTGQGRVSTDGDVTFTIEGGMYIYTLALQDSLSAEDNPSGGDPGKGNPNNPNDQRHLLDYSSATINTPAPVDSAVIWCAADGDDTTADGSEARPFFDIQKAVDKALPGTTIKMKAGTYFYDKRININDRNGTSEKYITVMCPDGRAVLDFSKMPYHAHSDNPQQGIRLTSSYWHFYKIDVCNASDNGLLIERSKPTGGSAQDVINRTQDAHDNIIEFCNFYRNGDTGVQMKNLASFNYILNCDAYENRDEGDGDADGFAPKISVGDGNYFYGCRAYNNSDDGYDVFFKKDGGFTDNKTIVMENCLAYENGFINGVKTKGNMNGFKMGSNQGRMNVVLNRCVAVNNGSKGFDQNHNSGDIILNNCTGMTLTSIGAKSYSYRIYETINTAAGHKVELNNCIAINDNDLKDKRSSSGEAKPSEHGKQGDYGRFEVDETLEGLSVANSNFHKASPELFESLDHTQLIAPRDADDNLPVITFAHIKKGATAKGYNNATLTADALIDTGKAVDATEYLGLPVPAITYSGAAPDLGAYETIGTPTTIGQAVVNHAPTGRARALITASGRIVIKVDGGALYNAAGQRLE